MVMAFGTVVANINFVKMESAISPATSWKHDSAVSKWILSGD